jgi:uncharacterized Fe-S center protein
MLWPMLLLGATAGNAMAATPSRPAYVRGLGQSVGSEVLAKSSGGTEVTETVTLNGTVTNNSTDHVLTGSNVIGNGAFDGATGVPMVIQNTGNGVLIQNATIINVQLKP